jgi:cytochrome d ubiquinol oxidase subunit I
MKLDPVLLSRIQWAWVVAWHILLPAFTVGLASYIAVLEGLYFSDSSPAYPLCLGASRRAGTGIICT